MKYESVLLQAQIGQLQLEECRRGRKSRVSGSSGVIEARSRAAAESAAAAALAQSRGHQGSARCCRWPWNTHASRCADNENSRSKLPVSPAPMSRAPLTQSPPRAPTLRRRERLFPPLLGCRPPRTLAFGSLSPTRQGGPTRHAKSDWCEKQKRALGAIAGARNSRHKQLRGPIPSSAATAL